MTPASVETTSSPIRPPTQPPRSTSNGPITMRLLHLYRPHLPLELARARASEPFPPGPLILGGRPWDPGPVVDADPAARALGVRRGMPLGSAHRLVPEAFFIDPDPDADRVIAEAAFEALAAFSPGIAGSAEATDPAFGLFEVQIDGLEPLWGPEPVLIGRLVAGLGRALPGRGAAAIDGEIRAGVAGTRFTATIAAVLAHPGEPIVVPAGGEAAFLAPPSVGPAHPGPRRPGQAVPLRPAPDRERSPSSTGRPWSPASVRRARGSTPGPAARSWSRSGLVGRPSVWPSRCPSSRPPRTSSRSASCSTAWPSP